MTETAERKKKEEDGQLGDDKAFGPQFVGVQTTHCSFQNTVQMTLKMEGQNERCLKLYFASFLRI